MAVQGIPVPVGKRMLALWSHDIAGDNRDFLDGLDPEYFRQLSHSIPANADQREPMIMATFVRQIRDQAAEMLFALLMALVQSPNGVALWMASYRNPELDDLLVAVSSGGTLFTHQGHRAISWPLVAREVTQSFDAAPGSDLDQFRQDFAEFWSRLAEEFVHPIARREYCCLKHGLRVQPGGCSITLVPQLADGVPDPSKAPLTIKGSGFGSSFQVPEQIGGTSGHYYMRHQHRHWNPRGQLMQISLITSSIQNVIVCLKAANGHTRPGTWKLLAPEHRHAFRDCWDSAGDLGDCAFGPVVHADSIVPLSTDELRARCTAKTHSGSGVGSADR